MSIKQVITSEFRFWDILLEVGASMPSPLKDVPVSFLLSELETASFLDGLDSYTMDNRWTRIVETIREWQRDPQQVEDEGIDPPTLEVLSFAQYFVERAIAEGQPAPAAVVPDGEGGLSFETYQKPIYQKTVISKDLGVEEFTFENSKLIHQRVLPVRGALLPMSVTWEEIGQSRSIVGAALYRGINEDSTTFSSEQLRPAA